MVGSGLRLKSWVRKQVAFARSSFLFATTAYKIPNVARFSERNPLPTTISIPARLGYRIRIACYTRTRYTRNAIYVGQHHPVTSYPVYREQGTNPFVFERYKTK